MKIILIKDVSKLGKPGDIVDVADGFARNYLIPKGLGEKATEASVNKVRAEKQSKEREAELELSQVEEIVKKIDGLELDVFVKVDDGGQLYGSVDELLIAETLKNRAGVKISEKDVVLVEPIKTIGTYQATINFPHGLEAQVKVVVQAETDGTAEA